jgi:Helix-turn-helix domain
MSIRLMAQVWEDTRVDSQAELLVLLALADHARDDGLCWPSMRTIAKKARIEERSAQRIVRRLIEKGLIELVSKGGCIEGHNTPNHYRVMVGEFKGSPGLTLSHPGMTVSRGEGGDAEDVDGVTHRHPNHHKEPPKERMTTTTHPRLEKKLSQANEPTESSSSRRDNLAACLGKEADSSCNESVGTSSADVSALTDQLASEFGLSRKQRETVRAQCESRGEEYVRSKARIVRSEPRRNAAGCLLAALRDDWQPPVLVGRSPRASEDLARRMGWQW